MTILSDREIKELCTKPLCTYQVGSLVGVEMIYQRGEKKFFGTQEQFNEFVRRQKDQFGFTVVSMASGPYLMGSPMISPFTDTQVREGLKPYKNLTSEERRVIDQKCHEEAMKYIGEELSLKILAGDRDKSLWSIDSNLDDTIGMTHGAGILKGAFYDDNKRFRTIGDYFEQIYVFMLNGDHDVVRKVISYGLSSYGYDVRLGNKFKIFTNVKSTVIDPMNMSDDCYVDFEGDVCIIPPHSYVLGHTIETFDLPRDVVAVCLGKSTYARAGCAINVTPIEPGFRGQVVIEIANQTPLPMKVYANMGIAQFMFHRGQPCEVSYADRDGKYQDQKGITTARL